MECQQGFHHCSSEDTFAHTTQDAIVFVKSGAELVAGEVRFLFSASKGFTCKFTPPKRGKGDSIIREYLLGKPKPCNTRKIIMTISLVALH